MRRAIISCISAAALLGAAGCGSDNDADGEQAATATITTPAGGQVTTTSDERSQTTTEAGGSGRLSPQGRAVLASAQDLAADVGATAQEYARGRIEKGEAMARLEIASQRADDLRRRAQQLPATERARARITLLTSEISRTATAVAKLVSSGRAEASRDQIAERITNLRGEARSTFDALSKQLDERAQKRFRDALDRIGAETPG